MFYFHSEVVSQSPFFQFWSCCPTVCLFWILLSHSKGIDSDRLFFAKWFVFSLISLAWNLLPVNIHLSLNSWRYVSIYNWERRSIFILNSQCRNSLCWSDRLNFFFVSVFIRSDVCGQSAMKDEGSDALTFSSCQLAVVDQSLAQA